MIWEKNYKPHRDKKPLRLPNNERLLDKNNKGLFTDEQPLIIRINCFYYFIKLISPFQVYFLSEINSLVRISQVYVP